MRSQHCGRPRACNRRQSHSGISWTETTQHQPIYWSQGHYQYLWIDRTRDNHERHCYKNRSTHQRKWKNEKRKVSCGTACRTRSTTCTDRSSRTIAPSGTGSSRSVVGLAIYDAIKNCRDILENFGGHTYAVGLTLRQENIPEFRRRFQEYVKQHILPEQTLPTLDIDEEIDFKDITKRLHGDLRKLAPHGPANEKPLFLTRNVYDYGTSKVVGRHQEHIKLELVDSKSAVVMNGIAFGQSADARYIKSKRSFDIVYTIEENAYKRGDIQLQITDIRPSETPESPK